MISFRSELRLDRFLSCFVVHPLIRRRLRAGKIPILMYHSISWEQDNRIFSYFDTNTYPSVFEDHIKFLISNNYKPVLLADILAGKLNNSAEKYVVITFDDGYRDFYTSAFPVLQKYNVPGTMFLPTGYIGFSRDRFLSRPCLDWHEVHELSEHGIDFGSHSHSHFKLTELSPNKLKYDLKISKEIIEDRIGRPVISFSYPFAFPDENRNFVTLLKRILLEHEFQIGVTTRIGLYSLGDDLLTLRRIPVNSHDDMLLFSSKLDGAYDWLGIPQMLFKQFREFKF